MAKTMLILNSKVITNRVTNTISNKDTIINILLSRDMANKTTILPNKVMVRTSNTTASITISTAIKVKTRDTTTKDILLNKIKAIPLTKIKAITKDLLKDTPTKVILIKGKIRAIPIKGTPIRDIPIKVTVKAIQIKATTRAIPTRVTIKVNTKTTVSVLTICGNK